MSTRLNSRIGDPESGLAPPPLDPAGWSWSAEPLPTQDGTIIVRRLGDGMFGPHSPGYLPCTMAISDDDRRQVPDTDPPDSSTTETSPPWAAGPLDDIRPPLLAAAAATPQDAARLRHELAAWLALDVPDEPLEDLVLATYEAIANAAEHAYADHTDAAGPLHLRARRTSDCVVITVTDEGEWRTPVGRASAAAASP